MLVWDENHRNGQDDELRRLVLRDRNHPSIIIWSICNEKLCNTNDSTGDGHRMHYLFHHYDPYMQRVVSANNNAWSSSQEDTPLDLQGIDYAPETYDKVWKNNPDYPLVSSESSSAWSDRAWYAPDDPVSGHVPGYDTEGHNTAEAAWGGQGVKDQQGILTRDFISGGFTWTGFDYKGEPTPTRWFDQYNLRYFLIDFSLLLLSHAIIICVCDMLYIGQQSTAILEF